jgi:hypothetical protein
MGELLEEMPYLRWAMLRTSMEASQSAYEKRLGMAVLQSEDIKKGPVMMGRKGRVPYIGLSVVGCAILSTFISD